ncbi:E3 ubiquitin-protein ligase RFWD3 isoform X2 [Ricinus communis]|uniref:E3 ubiquitin-protein ligase RFWD3 isoform X2 n=1 Tax=Ricinus communis TaxID=3988 RepID=UPI00077284EC|nr:E3 ubiquitin-protein ligase RFWD3 isoform X2 [Ricinus communis]|eukprot:XP_015581127.1 E3 ubiquitin-protein ligase RFWD3 isoform X2 [Ricinus communis]
MGSSNFHFSVNVSLSQVQDHVFISVPQSSSSDSATPMVIDNQDEEQETVRITTAAAAEEQRQEKKVDSSDQVKEKRETTEPNSDGLCCSICLEPWNSQGDHQVSCLPCGHVYGFSCISRWLQVRLNSGKCPQCNAKCTVQNVRKLYASPVAAVNGDQHKKVQSLEAEIGSLKKQRLDLLDIQDKLIKIQDNLLKELHNLKENRASVENMPFVQMGSKTFGFTNFNEARNGQFETLFSSRHNRRTLLRCNVILEHELAVEGARLFAIDITYQNLILARRISGMGGIHMLNKINLINPHENEDIQLPTSTKTVKDLQISPCGRLTLLASLGKKLSILSMESNSIVTTYNLRVPAWSCSWDLNSPHYMYAGLQNGMILVFDMRHTVNPLQSMIGLTPRPIHTIHSLVHNPALGQNAQKLLTASSLGPCVWDVSAGESETERSYQESSTVPGQGILGTQVLVKRVAGGFYHNLGSTPAYLNDAHMENSAIINMENCFPLLAYADGVTHGLRLRELPSLTVSQNLKPHHHPILDVKCAHTRGTGVLGCVSEDKLQLFSLKIL